MRKLQIVLLLMLMVLFAGCSGDAKVVNIGLLMVPNDAILAKQMGLFEDKFGELGYDVNYQIFDSGSAANVAIVTGETDFATMGNINGLVALGRNMDAELVWIHETLGAIEALAVKTDLNIESPEDLAGLKIATPFSSTAHYVLLNVLKEAGLSETDVDLYNMNTASIVAAWENGSIDAAYTWQPSLGILLNNGGEVLIDSEDMIEKGYMTANIELARKTFAEEHPELVEAYIECMYEANEYYQNNRTDAIAKLADELDIEANDVLIQVEGSIWTSLTEMKSETFISGYVDTMYEQTIFMFEQALLDRVVTRAEVATFINNEYAIAVETSSATTKE
ncbi:MAG: ABC transporter substrate-binding protein [Tenericutes bacterium]|nr:ABC transporter substrate-binding protein [Mycoplasmatota bacterium]